MAKNRSPNYPTTDLATALELARPAWKEENRNKMSRSVLASHMGYTSLNGRALTKLGAVRAYGLIEGSGDDLRISDDAVTALAIPDKNGVQYKDALLRLATKPPLFQEIKKQFPETLPSEGNVSFWLIQKRNFTQEAAGKAAKSFLTTMRLVFDESGEYPTPQPSQGAEQMSSNVGSLLDRPGASFKAPPMLQEVFNLVEGPVTLTYPSAISSDSYEDLKAQLELILRRAKRRAQEKADD